MDIIGNGFLSRHLAALADRHRGWVVLAAGVTAVTSATNVDYQRERDLLARTLNTCRNTGKKLVFLSTASTAMYGVPGAAGQECDAVRPSTPYGRHKRSLEQVVQESAVDHLVLRLAHVTGPHQKPYQLLPSLAAQVRSGTVQIHQGATRDLIDVDDLVEIVDRLLVARVTGEIVNVASGVSIPVERIVDRLESRLGTLAVRETTRTAAPHAVSIDKLHRLITDLPEFPPDYPLTVIDRYLETAGLPATENSPRAGRSLTPHR